MARQRRTPPGVAASFESPQHLLDALRGARAEGIAVRDVRTPVPMPEVDPFLHPRTSPVKYFTLVGALLGLAGGMALAVVTSMRWNLIVGGKPVTSIVPFLVVGFEATILFGALATLGGLLLLARLPSLQPTPHHPRWSCDRFGLWLEPKETQRDRAKSLLRSFGAVEIMELVDTESGGEQP